MQCDRASELLSPYLDGELSADERGAVAGHIETCRRCAAMLADLRRVSHAISDAGREPAPASLMPRVRAALAQAASDEAGQSASVLFRRLIGRNLSVYALMRQAAVVAAACLLTALATWWLVDSSGRQTRLEQELLSAHLRSLLQDGPIQVASSDAHTVKPWFAGRVAVSPDVKDLSTEGFPLIGGRLDYIDDRRVAAVVYKRRLHTINIFAWPSSSVADTSSRLVTLNGYNLLNWSRNGVTYWAISDLSRAELERLPGLL
jgi:anti-sigma factor RsiW